VSALGAVAIVVACLAACGRGASGDAVIRVGRNSISRATVDHWTVIQSTIDGEPSPRRPVPRGLVPDPPRYAACIGYLRASETTATKGGETPPAELLRSQCKQRYEDARNHVLAILITYQWLIGEGKEQGVAVSDDEVAKQMTEFRQGFHGEAAFRDFLRANGKSIADESLILKIDVLLSALKQRIVGRYGATAAGRFFQVFPKRWAAKTSCAAGYVVPNCKQYKGSDYPKITT
jgi:hypothetical protein